MLFDADGNLIIPVEEQTLHTISYDEKPVIQAIATTSPDLNPTQENGTIQRDYEYKRLGICGRNIQTFCPNSIGRRKSFGMQGNRLVYGPSAEGWLLR